MFKSRTATDADPNNEDDDGNSHADSLSPRGRVLTCKLPFQYKGDVFSQRGSYTDSSLYLSRLPSTRKTLPNRMVRAGHYKPPARLEPMQSPPQSPSLQPPRHGTADTRNLGGATSSATSTRKQQYALAVESMASNPALHPSLLSESVVGSVLTMCRSKDLATLRSCVTTLDHLSREPDGRAALVAHNAVAVLVGLAHSLGHDRRELQVACLGVLSNLTIEDGAEPGLIKDKALECLLRHRKGSRTAERACIFAVFNLSCPNYSYPRVDDVVSALTEVGKGERRDGDGELLSRAVYNISSLRTNHSKMAEVDVVGLLRGLMGPSHLDATRRNTLAALWHLAGSSLFRRALARGGDCVRVVVDQLRVPDLAHESARCVLAILEQLALDVGVNELMARAQVLDVLATLSSRVAVDQVSMHRAIHRLLAAVLAVPANIATTTERVFHLLLDFEHTDDTLRSRSVLFALASILSWSDLDARQPRRVGAVVTPSLDDILDQPDRLKTLHRVHISSPTFAPDSTEAFLQTVLLYNMSFRYSKVDVARLGIARLLLDVEHSRTRREEVIVLAAGCFLSLCQEYEVHSLLVEPDGLKLLQRLLADGQDDARSMCLDAVCLLFDGRTLARADLAQLVENVLPSLLSIYASGSSALRACCGACLSRFATVDECRLYLVERGVFGVLARLAADDNAECQRHCATTYALLASRDAANAAAVGDALIQSGLIKALMLLADAPEEAVRRVCVTILCNLSATEANVGALVHHGALRALLVLSCVKSNDPETRRVCLKAVLNLLCLPAHVARMCQEGLLWAFGLFAGAVDARDHGLLADVFCALTFYAESRAGLMKPAMIAPMLTVLASPTAKDKTRATVLRGLVNVLSEPEGGAMALRLGIVPLVIGLLPALAEDGAPIVAQLLALVYQSGVPDAEPEFARAATVESIMPLLAMRVGGCSRSCAVLLLLMSRGTQTRTVMAASEPFWVALPGAVRAAASAAETPLLLLRCMYNVSGDGAVEAPALERTFVPAAEAALRSQQQSQRVLAAELLAAIARNLSTMARCHSTLTTEAATSLMDEVFAIGSDATKTDVAMCTCNLLLGRVNSHLLLSRAVLPHVLWLCAAPDTTERVMASAVLRKLATAPGNASAMLDGGAPSYIVQLLRASSDSVAVQSNCIATLGLLAQNAEAPAVLASYGVITLTLELLDTGELGWQDCDPGLTVMCLDLLSALAAFANADDPREATLATVLFQLMEKQDAASACSAWRSDRSFLAIPATPLSAALRLSDDQTPRVKTTLYPPVFSAHTVAFSYSPSYIETRTIEAIVPGAELLVDESGQSQLVEFEPPDMFPKLQTPIS